MTDFNYKELTWARLTPDARVAYIGERGDGVEFIISEQPTCYRRGPYKLYIEIYGGPNHHKWGCFDEQDQPIRYYHLKESAIKEANEIAKVLLSDRLKIECFGEKALKNTFKT